MIIAITKKYENGKWVEFDASKKYQPEEVITVSNGDKYKVAQINGSEIKLEELI